MLIMTRILFVNFLVLSFNTFEHIHQSEIIFPILAITILSLLTHCVCDEKVENIYAKYTNSCRKYVSYILHKACTCIFSVGESSLVFISHAQCFESIYTSCSSKLHLVIETMNIRNSIRKLSFVNLRQYFTSLLKLA